MHYNTYVLHRFDYLLISHFLLNLQDFTTVLSNAADSDLSRASFDYSSQGRFSSVRFANNVIGNLGASLRTGAEQEDDESREEESGTETDDHSRLTVVENLKNQTEIM